jgi:hypothetical protein
VACTARFREALIDLGVDGGDRGLKGLFTEGIESGAKPLSRLHHRQVPLRHEEVDVDRVELLQR